MSEILYLDLYFLINFSMDLVALAVSGLATSEKTNFKRLFLASFFGAVISCVLVCLHLGKIMNFLFSIPALFAVLYVGFGKRNGKRMLRITLFYLASSLFLGGAVEAISYYMGRNGKLTLGVFLTLLFLSFGVFQLFGRSLNRKLETAVVSLSIRFSGRSEYFFGLVDSGLLLRDPEKGLPVLILKAEYASPLLSREEVEKMKNGGEGSVPIPMKTASGEGLLYAFRPDGVNVVKSGNKRKKKEEREVLVALDFSGGGFGGCPCLVPLSVL